MTKSIQLKQIARLIKGELVGDGELSITGVKGIEQAGAGDITFLAHAKYVKCLAKTKAAAIIVPALCAEFERPQILVANPYLALAQLLEYFYSSSHKSFGVHPLAVIGKNPSLAEGISIYPWAVLGDEVKLGPRVQIHSGTCIGDKVSIGADSIIHPQVTIYPGITLGERVIIHSGSVIGSPGFGYIWDGEKNRRIPQVGSVVIEDDVEIGANVTIDRGTMGNTFIGHGVKIDNLVQIAHNVTVGEHSIIVAQVGISGSTRIGRQVTIGGQAGLVGHIQVGDRVKVAAKSGVSKDVADDSVIAGYIGRPHSEWRKREAAMRRLPKLQAQVQELRRRLEKLEKRGV
jgi:UDP-3-O-[3-hydroxymyristoyl] glucosamine N-acyltransferase